jgi:hypothetical protein
LGAKRPFRGLGADLDLLPQIQILFAPLIGAGGRIRTFVG